MRKLLTIKIRLNLVQVVDKYQKLLKATKIYQNSESCRTQMLTLTLTPADTESNLGSFRQYSKAFGIYHRCLYMLTQLAPQKVLMHCATKQTIIAQSTPKLVAFEVLNFGIQLKLKCFAFMLWLACLYTIYRQVWSLGLQVEVLSIDE